MAPCITLISINVGGRGGVSPSYLLRRTASIVSSPPVYKDHRKTMAMSDGLWSRRLRAMRDHRYDCNISIRISTSGISKEMLPGTAEWEGRPRKMWLDNIKDWT